MMIVGITQKVQEPVGPSELTLIFLKVQVTALSF